MITLPPNFEPMLAYNEDYVFPNDITLPAIVSPKYDGIRVLNLGFDRWYTKHFKPIPSAQARAYLLTIKIEYVDAELLVVDEDGKYLPYNTIQSYVSSQNKPLPNGWRWVVKVFDSFYMPGDGFQYRRDCLISDIDDDVLAEGLLAPCMTCYTTADLELWCGYYSMLYEGAIIRNPSGRYKYGRCTLKDNLVFKYVKLVREEGIITGVTENDVHVDRIGALVVQTDKWGTIQVGSGFDHAMSREFRRGKHMQRTITYEYKPHGMKDKPRQPAFVGFRCDADVGTTPAINNSDTQTK